MAPADQENYARYRDVADSIDRHLRVKKDYVTILTNRGEYGFVTIDATGSEAEAEETQSDRVSEEQSGFPGADASESPTVSEDGIYTHAEDVALYLHLYGRLPQNFITKSKARELGWSGGGLEDYAPGKCIGGDRFGNYEGLLPENGKYRECDIDTLGADSRGAKRLIYSDDGGIWYTEDHYASFTRLY
ncbi:MAG: ribonuclease [Lachnospiraceae bacterium]|nr:ribonuclease [Lachnospiraceae bacterium]